MLELAVFVCGAAVMVIELTGSRILAPYLGTSLTVWTSLIGLIMASLSLGYWWGGRLADRRPEAGLLGRIILLAAASTALVAVAKGLVFQVLQAQSPGLRLAAVAATLVLFGPPSFLLGMVAPFAVRLRLSDPLRSGRTAGRLYALSTAGSIVGTFLTGFVLIAWAGSGTILLITAAGLCLASLFAHRGKPMPVLSCLALILLLFLVSHGRDAALAAADFVDADTPYNRILVYAGAEQDTGRMVRIMATGPQARQSAMYLDAPDELALPYTRFFRLAGRFRPDMRRMLVLGGGACSFPRFALAAWPGLQVDVVELDPGVTALARSHFHLADQPGLRIVEEDGRTFLNRSGGGYDVIICDAFNSDYAVPFHLATLEAARLMRGALTENGVALVNMISPVGGARGRFYRALFATYAEAFPEVRAYAVEDASDPDRRQNVILAAFAKGGPAAGPEPDPELAAMLACELPRPAADVAPFTDEYAPVDRYLLTAW